MSSMIEFRSKGGSLNALGGVCLPRRADYAAPAFRGHEPVGGGL
jgi:hypothetical protein